MHGSTPSPGRRSSARPTGILVSTMTASTAACSSAATGRPGSGSGASRPTSRSAASKPGTISTTRFFHVPHCHSAFDTDVNPRCAGSEPFAAALGWTVTPDDAASTSPAASPMGTSFQLALPDRRRSRHHLGRLRQQSPLRLHRRLRRRSQDRAATSPPRSNTSTSISAARTTLHRCRPDRDAFAGTSGVDFHVVRVGLNYQFDWSRRRGVGKEGHPGGAKYDQAARTSPGQTPGAFSFL